ncbi:transposase [Pelosinus sp. UFO1]|nr:transposase [Pelosinus sp. UFO1]
MQSIQMQLAKKLAKECRTVEDIHNKLKDFFKDSMQQILEAEMSDQLGDDKHSPHGNNTGNSRNG